MSAKTKTLTKLLNSVTHRTAKTLTRSAVTSAAGQDVNLNSYVQLKNAVNSSPNKPFKSKKSKLPSVLALECNRIETSRSLAGT